MNLKSISFFLKLMKIDFCLICFVFGYVIQNVTVIQLMEDKMCLNQLGLEKDFCLTLTTEHYNESVTQTILKKANAFKNYQFLIISIPALILSIYLGYWLGNYPKYFKSMIIYPLVMGACMNLCFLINSFAFSAHWGLLLLSYVPLALAGGISLIFSAVYTYISWSTPNNLAIIRFVFIDFIVQIGILLSTFLGGKILAMDPWIANQTKNYIGVFLVGLIVQLTGAISAYFITFEYTPNTDPVKDKLSFMSVIGDVFQFSRLKQPASIFSKKRPNNGRLRLIALITSGAVSIAAIMGEDGIAYQFAQRVYGLTEDQYTSIFSLATLIPSILAPIGPAIFRGFLGLSDSTMAMIGSLSLLLFFLIRGIFLSVPGYIAGYLIGSFKSLANASVRTLVSDVVDPAETAQVFTLATALENYIALGSTLLYTSVFSLTIERAPGFILIMMAGFQLYPLSVFCWTFFTRSKWQNKTENKNEINNEHPVEVSQTGPAIIETVMTSIES